MTAVTDRSGAPAPAFHTLSMPDALAAEKVDRQHGLSTAEAQERRKAFGPNKFAEARKEPWWRAFVRQYADLRHLREPGLARVLLEALVAPEERARHRRRNDQHVEERAADCCCGND